MSSATFHPFSRLPPEIRLLIWEQCPTDRSEHHDITEHRSKDYELLETCFYPGQDKKRAFRINKSLDDCGTLRSALDPAQFPDVLDTQDQDIVGDIARGAGLPIQDT
ncbi:hypothetical protein HYE67_006624 [Fusarium culmorum]|uniref:2EXR domain-containing protein n=1 Tax=Fusarium culmorum TaxID=5516 RepID=A0A2T4H0W4_FUSCU|nr:hypothetical protein FCULG_00007634 [Fusarium culmorum]QPC64393.1 hypothetical protein HYE67_006624 [Fusarium culmorum]